MNFLLTAAGTYVFGESSNPRKPGDKARLLSPAVDPTVFMTRQFCFQFWYNMFGIEMGTLNVYQLTSGSTAPSIIWSKTGQQGQWWRQASVNLTSTEIFYVSAYIVALSY